MKKIIFISIAIIVFGVVIIFVVEKRETDKLADFQLPPLEKSNQIVKPMKIESSAFRHNQAIPTRFTCDGENINPPLTINEVPETAKSLVIIADDPDAPAGTWLHWTVWNIDPSTSEIADNYVPEGVIQGATDFGSVGYGGPCPPSGSHRYFFKLFALDSMLDLESGASLDELEQAMEGKILVQAELMGTYQR